MIGDLTWKRLQKISKKELFSGGLAYLVLIKRKTSEQITGK